MSLSENTYDESFEVEIAETPLAHTVVTQDARLKGIVVSDVDWVHLARNFSPPSTNDPDHHQEAILGGYPRPPRIWGRRLEGLTSGGMVKLLFSV